jgi:hypothetical protein
VIVVGLAMALGPSLFAYLYVIAPTWRMWPFRQRKE